uniref:Bacteriocin immunity protein n=1 Tax=Chryseobacterium endophyticum TaxID=1854762 RepID=A0AAU6WQG5_9FLAO
MHNIQNLYKSLNERKRPEDIAELIADLMHDKLTVAENEILKTAAQSALNRNFFGYTSMLESFGEVIGADRQINKALEIFKVQNFSDSDYSKTEGIELFYMVFLL